MDDSENRAIAIVGVSAILPDAPDATTFWQNVKDGRYSIGEVPPERWDPELYWDPDPKVPNKTYSKIGGFVRDWEWEPLKWKLPIPPKVAEAMDEAHRWSIACARAVLIDAGDAERPLDRERTAVIVGSAMAGDQHYRTALPVFFPEYAAALGTAPSFLALPEDVRHAIEGEMRRGIGERMPGISEDTMPGELANCMGGRIANLFDFHGPNFVCDAACASALAAIGAAVDGLLEGEYDAAMVGGVDRNMGPAPFVKFCKIGALSATGTRPYGDGADGFVMGEGAAFFLLKRLDVAEQAGDRIYGVIRGVGGSSDGKGKGITAPNPAGQKLAIERAWRAAGLGPETATLIEGHGTSTRVGDVVEVETLNSVFGGRGLPPGSIALGSAKSNIGHLKGAAGAAGLLKALFALHEKVLPPSLHCEKTNPNIDFSATPFQVSTELKPWDTPACGVRRAGVSAFGFGGTNFHAVLEEYVPGRLGRKVSVSVPGEVGGSRGSVIELKAPPSGAVVLGAADVAGLRARLGALLADAKAGRAPAPAAPQEAELRAPERLAIQFADAAELATRAERAAKALASDQPALWKAVRGQGVFRGSGAPGKVAFLYTGQGSQYVNMLRELRESEPTVRETFAEADRVMEPILGRPLSDVIFADPADTDAVKAREAELRRTEITQPAVLTVDAALTRLLAAHGIQPDIVMGHSLGEYGALVASGALPFGDALEAVSARGREMAGLQLEDAGKMAAIFAPLADVEELVAAVGSGAVIANVNSTSQAVVGGATGAVESLVAACAERGLQAVELPVSHAFHTSIVAPASDPLRRTLERLRLAPPEVPVVANVNGALYPTGPEAVPEMLDLLAAQVASPVQFVKGLHTLYEEGARIFVEVGPKKALHGFVSDVLGGRDDVLPLFTNHPKVGEAASVTQALCGLWAAGVGIGQAAARPAAATASTSVGATAGSIATPSAPATSQTATLAAAASAPADVRVAELGRLVVEFLERGAQILGTGEGSAPPPVVTGAALGLPGGERVFDDRNVQHILDGEQEIDLIPTRFRHAMLDKHITRLVKTGGGGPRFETIEESGDVIKLAARAGALDVVEDFGVDADRNLALDVTTRLAIAAGIEALHDAGIPLSLHYRTTTKNTQLPERWMLPEPLRDETGVIFASAFPGFDAFADELARHYEAHGREARQELLQALRDRFADSDGVVREELDRRLHELAEEIDENPYQFDRRLLFRMLPMAHAQFAEHIGARGPNTHVNSACASTTQAFALAEDWIRAGRCRRVVVIAGDDVTTERLIEWIGSGFLASGAAATDDVVEEAALPFDRRRHGMILGMGAAGVVIESPDCARERGLRPICEVVSTVTANSAFHGTRLDVSHIAEVMERLVAQAERRLGVDRHAIAPELLFVSHETYTPARGGSASAEVESLRRVFGASADRIVVANTKGLTGHPMGVGIEDVVAVKALETGVVPPVPNWREPDPDLGPLNLSKGGSYPVRWALRLGAGFGSQISMSLLRWTASPDGRRPSTDALGFATRLDDASAFESWVRGVSGDAEAELEVVKHTLRVKDRGPAAAAARLPAAAPALAAARPIPTPTPPAVSPAHAEPTPAPVAASMPPPAAAPRQDDEAAILERVLAIVAQQTGYPADMLDPELDLEADLGIDTVKQAETFAAIREAWGIPRDENLQLRDYPTLAHAVRFVIERMPGRAEGEAAAEPAATTAADSAPTPAAGDDEAAILERVLAIVAAQTGYPADMLDPELDLEADLGIDTVKQAETFAAIREAWGIPRDENLQLRDYPTLAHAVRFVIERMPGRAEGEAAAEPAATTAADSAPTPAAGDDEAAILERVLAIVAAQTGYPADMLDPELDLEADLGIDTVKQAETFAAIREAWGIPRDENLQLRDYPTLAHAVRFVIERMPDRAEGEAAAEPAATTAADSAPTPAAGDDEAAILERVLAIVAEQTGYPADMLDPELDLEADLGIDTVKQAETFAAIREAWGIPRDENLQLRDYPTLAHAVRFVIERRPAGAGAPATPTARASEDEAENERELPGTPRLALLEGSLEAASRIPRRVPTAVLRPPWDWCAETGVSLQAGSRVVLMPDRGGVAAALVRRLEKRGAEVLSLEGAEDREAVVERIRGWRETGPIHGSYWLAALDAEGDHAALSSSAWRSELTRRAKLLEAGARALYDELESPDRFLVAATRLGGRHGYEEAGAVAPLGGAVVGFVKALARERADALVKAVDFPVTRRTAELADALVEETLRDPGAVEVGLRKGERCSVALVEQPRDDGAPGLALDATSTFVVTGAAGGIVSAIVADLARGAGGGTFHLLDLVSEPDPSDPELLRFQEDRDGLRRTIFERLKASGERATPALVERELAGVERAHAAAAAIEAVRHAGGTVRWHSVDLKDAEAVAKALEEARSTGQVDVVLHAAGLERSQRLPDKPDTEFDLVFDVKADGWHHLMRGLDGVEVAAVVAFSSIAGRLGNAGQTDYAAANDLLCKCVSALRRERPDTRALAIDWTAWGGIGMATRGSIPEIMARAGIDMLPPEAGAALVRQELTASGRRGEVLLGERLGVLLAERHARGGLDPAALAGVPRGPLLGEVVEHGVQEGLCVRTRLDPAEQPFLHDHEIDGVPVLPGVMGIEAFVELAGLLRPDLALRSVEDVRFLAPFKFYRGEPRELELRARFEPGAEDAGGVLAHCKLVGRRQLHGRDEPQETLHFSALVHLAPGPLPEEHSALPGAPPASAVSGDDIYRVYFHGPAFQVLDAAWGVADRTHGRIRDGLPPALRDPENALRSAPRLTELAFQTAGVGEIGRTGSMGLPLRIASLELGGPPVSLDGCTCVVKPGAQGSDALVLDAEGRVRVRMRGYETAALPGAIPDALRAPLAAAIAAEEEEA